MEIFLDALLDALIDGVKMLPFLYLAYLLIEWLERHHGENIENALAGGGRWGFLPGALLGCVPQCGFSIQLLRQPGHHPRHIAGRIYRHQRRGHSAAGR